MEYSHEPLVLGVDAELSPGSIGELLLTGDWESDLLKLSAELCFEDACFDDADLSFGFSVGETDVGLSVTIPHSGGTGALEAELIHNCALFSGGVDAFSSPSPQSSPARVTVDSDIVRRSDLAVNVRRPD